MFHLKITKNSESFYNADYTIKAVVLLSPRFELGVNCSHNKMLKFLLSEIKLQKAFKRKKFGNFKTKKIYDRKKSQKKNRKRSHKFFCGIFYK